MDGDLFVLFAYLHGSDQFFNILKVYKNFNLGTFLCFFFSIMKNGGKLKTENNVYNEACDDGNSDVQSKRQATGFNLCLFLDLSSTFSKKVFQIGIAVIHTGI